MKQGVDNRARSLCNFAELWPVARRACESFLANFLPLPDLSALPRRRAACVKGFTIVLDRLSTIASALSDRGARVVEHEAAQLPSSQLVARVADGSHADVTNGAEVAIAIGRIARREGG